MFPERVRMSAATMGAHSGVSRESEQALRSAVIATALAMNARGINRGKSGNVSARLAHAGFDGFVVTPTGLAYDETRPEDIVPVTLDGEARGSRLPSSEWRFHRDIYRARPEVNAVVHTHAPFATTLACLSRGIPAFHYMVAVAGGRDIRCAPYATFGTQELSDHVLAALDGRRACLLAHHGMIAVGASLPDALALAVEVETLAEIYWRALSIGRARDARRRRNGRRAREVQDLRTAAARGGVTRSPGTHALLRRRRRRLHCRSTTHTRASMPDPLPIAKTSRQTELCLLPALANRHGLITGATGTGKTVTLQVMAERFSRIGVPVFMADVKGDLSGITPTRRSVAEVPRAPQADRRGRNPPTPDARRCSGTSTANRVTRSARRSRTWVRCCCRACSTSTRRRSGVLALVFKVADDNGLLLLDLKDLRAMLQHVGDHAQELQTNYGNVSAASVGAIQRGLLALEQQGARASSSASRCSTSTTSSRPATAATA